MSDFSMSGAALLQTCRYPFRDDVVAPPESDSTEERELGTRCHAAAAQLINSGGHVVSSGASLGDTWKHMAAWIAANHKPSWVAEVALAWNPTEDTSRQLGVDIDRKYKEHGLQPGEVPGTCDLVSVEGDIVRVYEFGTGWNVEHKLEQLRLQCVAAARAFRKERAVGYLVQFRDDGVHTRPPIDLDGFELAAIAGEFAALLAQVPGSAPVVSEGCSDLFCDVRVQCPATQEAQAALIPEGALVRKFSVEIADAEHARWMLERIRLVKGACEEIKDAINKYVPEGGIELADGKYIYEGAREMSRFDAHKALALCKQLGATEAQIASLTRPVIEGAGLKVGSKQAAESAAKKRSRAA